MECSYLMIWVHSFPQMLVRLSQKPSHLGLTPVAFLALPASPPLSADPAPQWRICPIFPWMACLGPLLTVP